MKLEKITWKMMNPAPDLRCCICNTGKADSIANIGNFRLPVCPECGRKTEGELLRAIGGQANEQA